MKKIRITESDMRYMVNEAIDKMPNVFDSIEGFEPDPQFDEEDDNTDDKMNSFYDAIEELASDGILCFRKIKEMLVEEDFAKKNAAKLQKTLDKITKICDELESFVKDYGRY